MKHLDLFSGIGGFALAVDEVFPRTEHIFCEIDPFMGAGTTAKVAKHLGRNYIGIELNPEYIKIAEKRLEQGTLHQFNE